MAASSGSLHEPTEKLPAEVLERHRAIVSLIEELEAIDWYDQRVAATGDAGLAAILAHNRDEEKEHAAMTLEWLRRHDPALDAQLRAYLFTTGPILEAAGPARQARAAGDSDEGPAEGSLGLGRLGPGGSEKDGAA